MLPRPVAYIECKCCECNAITKIPVDMLTSDSPMNKLLCPGCGIDYSYLINNVERAVSGYQRALSFMAECIESNVIRFIFE